MSILRPVAVAKLETFLPHIWKIEKPTTKTKRAQPSATPAQGRNSLRTYYSTRSSRKVRQPEMMVVTIDWRLMISSRIAA